MKKIFLSFLLLTSVYADSAIHELEKTTHTIKQTRLRSNGRPINPLHCFETDRNKSHSLLTHNITQSCANASERIEMLKSLYQDVILEKKYSLQEKTFTFSSNDPDYKQRHLAALELMKQATLFIYLNPLRSYNQAIFIENFIRDLTGTLHPIMQSYMNTSYLKILMPQGFFNHLSALSYNFKDYDRQDDLKIAFALNNDVLEAKNGFNINKNVSHLYIMEPHTDFAEVYLCEGDSTGKYRKIQDSPLFFQENRDPLTQLLFPLKPFENNIYYKDNSKYSYHIFNPTTDKVYTPASIMAEILLSGGYDDRELVVHSLEGSHVVVRVGNHSSSSTVKGFIDQHLNRYLDDLIYILKKQAKQNERARLLTELLENFKYLDTSSDMLSEKFLGLFTKESNNQLHLKRLKKRVHRARQAPVLDKIQEQFDLRTIGTHIDLPQNLGELIHKFQSLLIKESYRSPDFLRDVCQYMENKSYASFSSDKLDTIKHFLSDFQKCVRSFKIYPQEQELLRLQEELKYIDNDLFLTPQKAEEKRSWYLKEIEKVKQSILDLSSVHEDMNKNLYEYSLILGLLDNRSPEYSDDYFIDNYFNILTSDKRRKIRQKYNIKYIHQLDNEVRENIIIANYFKALTPFEVNYILETYEINDIHELSRDFKLDIIKNSKASGVGYFNIFTKEQQQDIARRYEVSSLDDLAMNTRKKIIEDMDGHHWIGEAYQYIQDNAIRGANHIFDQEDDDVQEFDRKNFSINPLFPLWKEGHTSQKTIDFGPESFTKMVIDYDKNHDMDVCDLAIEMYSHWYISKQCLSHPDFKNYEMKTLDAQDINTLMLEDDYFKDFSDQAKTYLVNYVWSKKSKQ